MSWDGVYAQDRVYLQFEVGDEVFTTKSCVFEDKEGKLWFATHGGGSWKDIEAFKSYKVIKCHKKPGMTIDIWVITLVTDDGYESEYASYQFQKTKKQLREDKLKEIGI